MRPTWSVESLSPWGGEAEGSWSPSGTLSCRLVLSPLWPSAAPINSDIYHHFHSLQSEGQRFLRKSDLQPHFLQQLLGSLHPLGDEALQLADRLGGRAAARLLFGRTATKSRTKLWPNHCWSGKTDWVLNHFQVHFIISLCAFRAPEAHQFTFNLW